MDKHPSHEWGPHERGLRWSQCQVCKVLLHEPEAELPCDPETVKAGREARQQTREVNMRRLAKQEAGEQSPPTGSLGLFQTLPPRRFQTRSRSL